MHTGLPQPRGAGMTGVSRGIDYPLLHEILHTWQAFGTRKAIYSR